MFEISSLSVGKPKPLNNTKINSSIGRDNHPEILKCFKDRLEGDQIELPKYHGGPDRVLHQYPGEHYEHWKNEYPEHAHLFIPGSIGENLLSLGSIEEEMRVGDIVRMGNVLAQITEPRKPCGTIDQHYGIKAMHKVVERESRCGWFYRILEEGEIRVGDKVDLIQRGPEDFDLKTVMNKSLFETDDQDYLERLKKFEALSERWRTRVDSLLGH